MNEAREPVPLRSGIDERRELAKAPRDGNNHKHFERNEIKDLSVVIS